MAMWLAASRERDSIGKLRAKVRRKANCSHSLCICRVREVVIAERGSAYRCQRGVQMIASKIWNLDDEASSAPDVDRFAACLLSAGT